MGLGLISAITLSILSGFMFIIIFLVNFYAQVSINLWFAIGIIVFINLIIWLIAPFFSDLIYKYFYKAKWISIDELANSSPKTVEIIKKICDENSIKIPKLGIISDENPTAFTYGSGKWNSRIIISHGIITFLNDDERSAVYAHELGHVKNHDFIIMTMASTLLQIFYEIYVVFTKTNNKSNNSDNKGKLAIVGIISYFFYFIGQYILLFLSRIREYYADEFSGKYTNPNLLADALIKIAYGIITTPSNNRLIESTKFIGIANDKMAKGIGMLYYNVGKDDNNELIEKSFLYDIKNPWAKISEFFSTHPLTGNRINRLMTLTQKPKYNINAIEQKFPVDKKRLYEGFAKDILILSTSYLLPIIFVIISTIINFNNQNILLLLIPSFIAGYGLSILIKTFWSYPTIGESPIKTTVLELMSDVYTSPVKGRSIELNGEIIGKGQAGYIFSEDVMLKDSTGIMVLDFQSKIPIIGNLIFSLTKVKKFIGQKVLSNGWFFRGVSHFTVINKMQTLDGNLKIKGGMRFWGLVGGIFFTIVGVVGYYYLTQAY